MTQDDLSEGSADEDPRPYPSLDGLVRRVQGDTTPRPEAQTTTETTSAPAEPERQADSEFVYPAEGTEPSDSAFEPGSSSTDLFSDAPNLLLLGPTADPTDDRLCADLLDEPAGPPESLLIVTYDDSPQDRLDVLRRELETLPRTIHIISVGTPTSATSELNTGAGTVETRSIRDAADVQRLGITISRRLGELSEDGGSTVLCFHSLTNLLRAVGDSERVYRFMTILTDRVASADARAHYHMDRDVHDDEDIALFEPLFTETVRFGGDGSLSVDY